MSTNPSQRPIIRKKSYRYHSGRYSYFSYRSRDFSPDKFHSEKIRLTAYCKKLNISKKQARKMIYLNLLNITYCKGQIWVEECDPTLIKEYLRLPD